MHIHDSSYGYTNFRLQKPVMNEAAKPQNTAKRKKFQSQHRQMYTQTINNCRTVIPMVCG